MTTRSQRAATLDDVSDPVAPLRERLDRAVAELRDSVLALAQAGGSGAGGIVARGLILLTEDDTGVARAVAADLRSLGHPVVRVRHGVAGADVEGVNLTSAAAVAALVDRVRSRGPVAAIVHASPLRAAPATDRAPAWDEPDDARALALLAQAAAGDLTLSSSGGGACLIVARRATQEVVRGDDRLSRWIEISARTLAGVRVRGLDLDPLAEPEVLAAEVVRAVLGTSERNGTHAPLPRRAPSEAFLLGAPDRAAWIHLAAALIDWLGDAPDIAMPDLAYTLHHRQPDFPFRVGLVATSGSDLAERLGQVIGLLADPSIRHIHDLRGAYWRDRDGTPTGTPRRARSWVTRLRGVRRERVPELRRAAPEPESLLALSGRDLLNHLAASRFARGEPIDADRLLAGRSVRRLDLSRPPAPGEGEHGRFEMNCGTDQIVLDGLDALDDAIALRRELLLATLAR